MTIIAWDGRYVAADTQGARECRRVAGAFRKIRVIDGRVYGYTGVSSLAGPMMEWASALGADPNRLPNVGDPEEDPQVIRFDAAMALMYCRRVPYPSRYNPPEAWGAGVDFAAGVMAAGLDAVAAVQLTILHHVWAGGMVDYVDLYEAELQVRRIMVDSPWPTPDRS